ncbi:MAG: ABC transporter substrate-binding protein [Actinomycetota bacterium]|nr:ABC transporter substrate-binding protein [Actinomycetota bacterium]
MKRWVVTLVGSMLLFACDAAPDEAMLRPTRAPVASPTSSDTRVIGLVGTLTGPDSARGNDAWEGADVGVSQLNQDVDPGRPPFELVTLDDRGDPRTATRLLQELALRDRTVGIIYAGPPEALPSAEAVLTQTGIPAILCFGDLYSGRLLRPHIFQASPPYLWQARAISRYLSDDRAYAKTGAIVGRDQSGDIAAASLKAAARDQDLTLVIRRYGSASDVASALKKLRGARAEAVIFQGSDDAFAEVIEVQAERGHDYRDTPRARIGSASRSLRARRIRRGWWHPQILGFDAVIAPGEADLPPGTLAADSYARGSHALPVPSFENFQSAFQGWWGDVALGWEYRGYDAARMIGWAAQNTRPGDDIARTLESMSGVRFGGLDITFGPDDHTAVDQTTVGLWAIPRTGFDLAATTLRWMPLARGFSIDGDRTAVMAKDWRFLFRNPPPPDGPAPRVTRMRYAVNSPRSDTIH